jgi:hypothetical protein
MPTDGRARRARSSRCRRAATAGAARGLRSSRIPSHRRRPPARSAGGSATHASDDSAARAAPRPPHRTPPPRGQDHREEHDSHAARDHGIARLRRKEGSRDGKSAPTPDPGIVADSARRRAAGIQMEMLVGEQEQDGVALLLDPAGRRSLISPFRISRKCRMFVIAEESGGLGGALSSSSRRKSAD